jgi:hypothetical protein
VPAAAAITLAGQQKHIGSREMLMLCSCARGRRRTTPSAGGPALQSMAAFPLPATGSITTTIITTITIRIITTIITFEVD